MSRLWRWWWLDVPVWLERRSVVGSAFAIREGAYLTTIPALATVLPPGSLLLGVLAALSRAGGRTDVFTESLFIVVLGLALGLCATLLGLLFTTAFSIVDFLLMDHSLLASSSFGGILAGRAGLLLSYVGLLLICTGVPLLVAIFRTAVGSTASLAGTRGIATMIAMVALFGGASTLLVVNAVPVLVRPYYVWQGSSPSVQAIVSVQGRSWLVALFAALIVGLRTLVEIRALDRRGGAVLSDAILLQSRMSSLGENRAKGTHTTTNVMVGRALLSGLVVSGLVGSLVAFIVFCLVFLAIDLVRLRVLPRLSPFTAIQRIPALLRLALALLLSAAWSWWYLPSRLFGTTFTPLLVAIGVSLLIFALLFPARTRPRQGGN